MPLTFAYGSNMDVAAMQARCPSARPLGVARLMRHRFLIMREGYASVVRDPRRTVWGLLWDVALADMPALDRYESLHTGLYAKALQPVVTQEGARKALIYVGRSAEPGPAKPGYMESVLEAARAAGLPMPYVAELATHLPGLGGSASAGAAPRTIRPTRIAPSDPPAAKPNWRWTP